MAGKNKDPLHDNLTGMLSGPSETYVAQLFAAYHAAGDSLGVAGLRKCVKKGVVRTVALRHKVQLANLAEFEEWCDAILFDVFSRLQVAGRTYMARRQIRKILNCASAVHTLQRNVRIYGELCEWPWW